MKGTAIADPSQNQYFNKPEFHGTIDNHLCADCVQKLFVIPHNQTLKDMD